MPTIYLSLGSNVGDREANLRVALERLAEGPFRITGVSPIYETVPVGETPQPVPDYLNCVARAETELHPPEVLKYTQGVERVGGRTPTFRWGPRTIDVDLLLYDDATVLEPGLTVPHPRMAERAFVLKPLADLEPDLSMPDGTRIADLLARPEVREQAVRRVES